MRLIASMGVMASDELRKLRLQRAKDFAERHRSNSSANISRDELAAIRKKADDLDAIQKSVSDAAAVGAPLWLSYIFLLFYVAIAAGGVTHTQLLLESPVDLPFLNIKLPLKAFFILAPILFLIVHAYVLAHFAMLSDKAKAFHDRLTAKVNAEVENDHAIREGLRQQLPINVFVQFLAGPTDIRESAFGVMLWVIAWTTLVGAPVAVLLLLQLQFLPYHDTRVTWLHRVLLCADLAVIWWLWMKILAGRDRSKPRHLEWWMRGWDDFLRFFRKFGAQFATALIAVFSLLFATFPGEWEDWPVRLPQKLERGIAKAAESIFGKTDALNDNENKRLTGNWPVNTLRLREFDIYAALGVEGPDTLRWKPYSFSLKDRRLEHADLRDARFDNIDLRGARLDGALLDGAKLEKAELGESWLPGASLFESQLQGASLNGAQLQGASLDGARIQGASLHGARLQVASLVEAELQGASISSAMLQGASLDLAHLEGASLDQAHLEGASLDRAHLQGALLAGASLLGASLVEAELHGASLFEAQLQGANLESAQLKGASLERTYLWRAYWGELDIEETTPILLAGANWQPQHRMRMKRFVGWNDEVWNGDAYHELRKIIEALPEGDRREAALERVASLDCDANSDNLVSCDPNAPPSQAVAVLRGRLEQAVAEENNYIKYFAAQLSALICRSDVNAIHVLRGISGRNFEYTLGSRFSAYFLGSILAAAGGEAPALIDEFVAGKNCPVSATLTDSDKAILQKIKVDALEHHPVAPLPNTVNTPPLSPAASASAPPAKAPANGKGSRSPRVLPPP
ncbi:hypothetical protein C5688_11165 [Methylocystis sp. MitZ-2018]|nr:hypothetical protein C5688_11165 [Methylocystis sp. MitZ-2018]